MSRTLDHDSLVSRANSFTAPAESSKCHFPRAIVVFPALPCGSHYFSHTKWLPKITDYRDTAANAGWAQVNSSSEDLHRGNPTTARICLPRVERGKYQQVGQAPRTVLPPAPDCLTSIATAIWLYIYHTLVLFFKIKSNLAPPYLTELLPQLSSHCG